MEKRNFTKVKPIMTQYLEVNFAYGMRIKLTLNPNQRWHALWVPGTERYYIINRHGVEVWASETEFRHYFEIAE